MDPNKQPGIRFTGVDLLALKFAISGQMPDRIPVSASLEIRSQLSEDKKKLDLFLKTDMFGNIQEEKKPPIELNFLLHGRFEGSDEANLSLQEFARHHAAAHLIPYVRELVANITARSILPTLNLGPINVIAMIDSGEASFEITAARKRTQNV